MSGTPEPRQTGKVASVAATPATHGTVSLDQGNLTYTADPGYVGPISFDYLVCDEAEIFATTEEACSSRTAQMAVNPDGAVVEDLQPSPVDPTVATSLYASTAFLYTGDQPLQRGVAPGTIDRKRAAVVRGRVKDREGQPLSDVRVAVEGHPELGHTLSRASGTFDLAVNGGGRLTLVYEKDGWSHVERGVDVPWGDYGWAPDVVLVPRGGELRTADLSTQLAVDGHPAAPAGGRAPGSGPAAVVPPETTAQLLRPDGSVQRLGRLSLQATEYGAGQGGTESMPFLPPAAAGVAYAVELRAAEAVGAQPEQVRLGPEPAAYYVENATGRPVGEAQDLHSYDRERDAWVQEGRGRVVAILGATDGRAIVDADGDGDRDFDDALALGEAGVSDAELRQLATLYPTGTTLWRLPLTHLGTWALWASDAAGELAGVQPGPARRGSAAGPPAPPAPEKIEVAGTPLSLRAAPSPSSGRMLAVPVTGSQAVPGLERIEVAVSVAGSRHVARLEAGTHQTYEFVWDGRDGYGRAVQGTFPASVEVSYVGAQDSRRTMPAGVVPLRSVDLAGQGLGGWALDAHHMLDVDRNKIYGGDGSEQTPRHDQLQRELETVAGRMVDDVAVGPDGSLYVAAGNQVRRVSPDRTTAVIAGSGQWGFDGDGGLAAQASFRGARAVAVAADGTVYVLDRWNDRVRRVGTDGVVTTVAGGGQAEPPYGGRAQGAALEALQDVAAGPDGSLYIADATGRVLLLGADGELSTLAVMDPPDRSGPVSLTSTADGVIVADGRTGAVTRVAADGSSTPVAGGGGVSAPTAVAAAADGTVYLVDQNQLRSIDRSGTVATVAAAPRGGPTAEGQAPKRPLSLLGLSVGPDGVVHVATPEGLFQWGASRQAREAAGEVRVPSASGAEVFAFDPAGRHLRTLNATTGAVRYEFGYDPGGRLTEVAIAGTGRARIERDPNGAALAVVAPDGRRTDVAPKVTRVLASDPVLGIPAVVLKAYRDAAATARAQLGCDMRWPILAAIGKSESGHATSGGARVNARGDVAPAIIGIPLDGRIGTARITDTDGGRLDRDTVFDRAVGPMQFIPSTWRGSGLDGNGDGVADPHNVFDATLAAARYLCDAAPPGRFSDRDQLAKAFLSYNHSSAYVAAVMADVDFYDGFDGLRAAGGAPAGAYALPIDRSFVDRNPAMLDRRHHDYPAIDLGVPVGTRVYAAAGGKVISVTSDGRCGNGVIIDARDGHRYTYCHAQSVVTKVGATVPAGQLIMYSGSTGNSSGPHLHLQIARADGTLLCPQPLVRAWYRGVGVSPASAPPAGCVS